MNYIFVVRIKVICVALLVISLASCSTAAQKLTITANGKNINVVAEIADTPEEQTLGLMYREDLAPNHGMFFVFTDESPRSFWMKNTFIPMDILFFNAEREVVSIVENMQPCAGSSAETCPSYHSQAPAMYALEVPAGFVRSHGINVGDVIE